jgi:hypothetical protein
MDIRASFPTFLQRPFVFIDVPASFLQEKYGSMHFTQGAVLLLTTMAYLRLAGVRNEDWISKAAAL